MTAVKEGFRTFQANGVQLLSSQTARQDVVLQVGAVVQTLEVAGHAQLVQTDSPTIGGTIATRELSDLPFVTTATDGLMNLVPGMSQGITNGNSNPDVGGAAYVGTSNWTVNGISTNNPGAGGGGDVTYIGTSEMIAQANLPAIGTLQEFKVESSVNGAEFRSQTAVTMVTKQGTNKFHGQAYEYNENKTTSANSFDLNKYSENETPFNRNQFGANLGGPILRDKMFFFVNYDGIREIHPTPVYATFPTPAMKQGNLSNLCDTWSAAGLCTDTTNGQQLYNPLTGQPFLNNQIPQSMITSQAKFLSNYLLAPNVNFSPTPAGGGSVFLQGSPFAFYDWAGTLPLRFGTNNAQMRLDGQIGSKDSVVGFATVSKGAPWFYGYTCCPNFGNWSDHGYNWYNLSATETHTFGPGTINEFRLGAVVTAMRSFGENLGVEPQSLFPQMPANLDHGLPMVTLNGYQGPYRTSVQRTIYRTPWIGSITSRWSEADTRLRPAWRNPGTRKTIFAGLPAAPRWVVSPSQANGRATAGGTFREAVTANRLETPMLTSCWAMRTLPATPPPRTSGCTIANGTFTFKTPSRPRRASLSLTAYATCSRDPGRLRTMTRLSGTRRSTNW